MEPPATRIRVTGGSYPAEIWQRYMQSALAGRPPVAFHAPPTTTTTTTQPTTPRSSTTTTAPRPRVKVPNVVGSKVSDAVRDMKALGFVVQRIPAEDDGGAPGRVVAQSPLGGTSAPAGSTVRIEVTE
jgi:hypothetical protein